jgi:apolipoprotein N-acyltransferase
MTGFSKPGWRALAGVVFSAVLFGLYARGDYGFVLGFVALVPWLLALDARPSIGATLRSGLLMSFAFMLAVFAWFGAAIGVYTGIGSTIGLLVELLAAPLLQPQFIAFALVRHLAGRRHGAVVRALAGASAWVATEWCIPRLLGDTIGHGLYPSALLRQFADLGGATGLTFLLIIVNECVAFALSHRREVKRAWVPPLMISASILITMTGYGFIRLQQFPSKDDARRPLRIGAVQSNIFDYERLRREMGAYEVVRNVLDTHFAMSRVAVDLHRVDALLWSETVYPTTFAKPKSDSGAELDREILDFVSAVNVPLVFGTYDRDDKGEYNAAAFVEPNNGVLGFYRKTDLFLFTEYVPDWLDGPSLRRWLPWAGAWKRGDGMRVFPLRLADGREIPVMSMICLDDVNPQLAIDGARLGGEVILSMSNDSWFTQYPIGATLHSNVAAFRSIETRLPQVRVTANGISAAISANGAVIDSVPMGPGVLTANVLLPEPSKTSATLMLAWGDWVGRAGMMVLLLLSAFSAISRPNKLRTNASGTESTFTATQLENFHTQGAVLPAAWRFISALLRLCTYAGVLYIGIIALFGDETQNNPLTQIKMFAVWVLLPEMAVWCIFKAFSAQIRIENGAVVLQQPQRRIEIPISDIAAVQVWKLPLPLSGINLQLSSGKYWPQCIAAADIYGLIMAMQHAGAPINFTSTLNNFSGKYAQLRASVQQRWWDHFAVKFILFPLVPALPAFRLHQHIAYGGTFGEYQSFGLKAYLIALFIWWASWAIGMVLFAALLRLVIELITTLLLAFKSELSVATHIRKLMERTAHLLFYIGVPVWLLIKFLP